MESELALLEYNQYEPPGVLSFFHIPCIVAVDSCISILHSSIIAPGTVLSRLRVPYISIGWVHVMTFLAFKACLERKSNNM